MSEHEPCEVELAALQALTELWKNENLIKTLKLQFLLTVNAVLLAAAVLNDGTARTHLALYLGGAVLCLIWLLSIGNTALHQKLWQAKMARLAAHHPDDVRFAVTETASVRSRAPAWLRVTGGMPSKYYLIGTPLVFAAGWLAAAFSALG